MSTDQPTPIPTDGSLPAVAERPSRAVTEIMAMKTGGELRAVVPSNIDEAFRFAQMVVQARLAPKSYEVNGSPDPQKVVIGILTALELGVPPLQGLAGIAIINGRVTVWGDLAVALVQSAGLMTKHEVVETGTFPNDDYTVLFRAWRANQSNPYEGKFSVEDAKRARLWGNTSKQPWIDYPKRMVFNRARAFCLRDGFSDALKGLSIAEEAQDLPPPAPPPVDTKFLSDESDNSAPSLDRAGPTDPMAQTQQATATAEDVARLAAEPASICPEDREVFDHYLEVLGNSEKLDALRALDHEVKVWIDEVQERAVVRGAWNSAKLSREKVLAARKT